MEKKDHEISEEVKITEILNNVLSKYKRLKVEKLFIWKRNGSSETSYV